MNKKYQQEDTLQQTLYLKQSNVHTAKKQQPTTSVNTYKASMHVCTHVIYICIYYASDSTLAFN